MSDKTFKLELGGKELIAEIRDLASKTNGNILLRYGDTEVLAAIVMSKAGLLTKPCSQPEPSTGLSDRVFLKILTEKYRW
jgi:hypothetical protein